MRPMRTRLGAVLLLHVALTVLGCSEKDVKQCQAALDGTRKSVAAENATLTTEWRERAYKYCADTASLTALDKEIVDTQAAAAAAKAAEAERLALNTSLLKAFATWAADNHAAPDHASVAPKCDGDDPDAGAPKAPSGAKASERFCTATRLAGTHTLTARYWEADKTVQLFMTKAPAPASCDDLGPNTVLKTWAVPASNGQSVKRTRCELSGSLAGLNAVVSEAANAPVYLFSVSYLAKDPALKKIAGE